MSARPQSKGTSNHPRSIWAVLKAAWAEWSSDHASQLAAAVAYYAIFSVGPLLMISIAIVSLLYGKAAAADQVRPHLVQFLGDKVAASTQQLLAAAHFSPAFSFAGILSIVLMVYAAANLFTGLQSALNTLFDVEARPGRGLRALIRDRAMSFLMVVIIGVLVLASIALNTFLAAVSRWGGSAFFGNHSAGTYFLLQVSAFIASCLVFTGVFALLFKYLPDVKIDWRDTLIGASATAITFTLARLGLGYYLGRSSTAGPFGAAGSLVILMLFVYYSAQILFFGAEFTQVWASRHGNPITPSRNATWRGEKFRKRKNGSIGKMGKMGKIDRDTALPQHNHWWLGSSKMPGPPRRKKYPLPLSFHRPRENHNVQSKGGFTSP